MSSIIGGTIVLIFSICMASFGIAGIVSGFRDRNAPPPWTIVCDGKGHYSFLDGDGALSWREFEDEAEALKVMVEEKERPKLTADQIQARIRERELRETLFKPCP